MKKIWIVGSLGHMGQALIRLLDMMEYELYETDKDELDITDEHAVSLFMHRNRPDVVINCAGYHPSAGAVREIWRSLRRAFRQNSYRSLRMMYFPAHPTHPIMSSMM